MSSSSIISPAIPMPLKVPEEGLPGTVLVVLTVVPLLVTVLWRLEEPSSLRTFVVTFYICLAAITLIMLFGSRILTRPKQWFWFFGLKIIITLLVLKFSWLLPFGGDQRRPDSVDMATYDYYAEQYSHDDALPDLFDGTLRGATNAPIVFTAWVYKHLGVSTLYVALINCLFALGTCLACAHLIQLCNVWSRPDILRYGLFFPDILFFDATPGKDTISTFAYILGLLVVLRLDRRKGSRTGNCVLLLITLGILVAMRPPLILAFFAISCLCLPRRFAIVALCTALLLCLAPQLFLGAFIESSRMDYLETTLKENESADPDRRGILEFLAIRQGQEYLWKGPVRSILLLVGPYPKILPDTDRLADLKTDYSVGLQEGYQKGSAVAVLMLLPFALYALSTRQGWLLNGKKFFVTCLFVTIVATANGSPLLHLRYRVLVEPLLLCAAAIKSSPALSVRSITSWISFITGGSVLYYSFVRLS